MNNSDSDKSQIYEIGYHLAPTIDEAKVPELLALIKGVIDEKGGKMISEESPKMAPLAYQISKSINSKGNHFDKALFGWVKFECPSDKIEPIKDLVQNKEEIIRFILVKTVRENTIYHPKFPRLRREGKDMKITVPDSAEPAKEVTDEEIDKSIEELVIA